MCACECSAVKPVIFSYFRWRLSLLWGLRTKILSQLIALSPAHQLLVIHMGKRDTETRLVEASEEKEQDSLISRTVASMASCSLVDTRRSQRLVGKVAVVTGGAMGIGESIVRLFHEHGAQVCILDIDDEAGKRVCEALGGDPDTCFFHCDVTVEDEVRQAVDFVFHRFGSLDIMVNNAGLSGPPCADIRDVNLADFEKVFDVNVKGTFMGMKHAARVMIPQKRGAIVSLCSVASIVGGLGPHAYTGSKHAVLGLTKNVAAELGKHRIRVNCVSPYAVLTNLALAHLPEDERTEDAIRGFRSFAARNANMQGLEVTTNDVAYAVLYLASDEARCISGENLMVDGGFTSTNHAFKVFR